MATGVKIAPPAPAGSGGGRPTWGVAGASLAGTLYVVLGFAAVYYLLPWLWQTYVSPGELFGRAGGLFDQGMQLILMAAAAVGWIFLGVRWMKQNPPPAGARAGTFLGVVTVLAGLLLLYAIARLAETAKLMPQVGLAVTGGVAVIILVFVWRAFQKDKFRARLLTLEEQGWFTAAPYKKTQGLRARRATMLGILILVGCGLWSYAGATGFSGQDWQLTVPFLAGSELTVLRSSTLTISATVALLALWLSYRLVNYPLFADFLIGTEAEMNKVSWSPWRRLVQDTIVVLTTVVLMVIFLFVVDLIWVQALQWINVLQMQGQ